MPRDHQTNGSSTPAPATAGDVSSFPPYAERARTIVGQGGHGTLGSVTTTGHPYTSLVAYVADDGGAPLFCVSRLAEHTANLGRDRRATLLLAEDREPGTDPLAHGRVTLVGDVEPIEPDPAVVARYHDVHPTSASYTAFGDFGWWRLGVTGVRFIGGFGAMGWVPPQEYGAASIDTVAAHAGAAIAHMNADHADACLLYARQLAGVEDAVAAQVMAIDRRGLTLAVETARGARTARLAFGAPLDDPAQIRAAVVELVERARRAVR